MYCILFIVLYVLYCALYITYDSYFLYSIAFNFFNQMNPSNYKAKSFHISQQATHEQKLKFGIQTNRWVVAFLPNITSNQNPKFSSIKIFWKCMQNMSFLLLKEVAIII